MKAGLPRRKWARWALIAGLVAAALPLGAIGLLSSGWADGYIRRAVVGQVERMTGGRVELASFHFSPTRLHVALGGLTIHGREPEGTPPFFHADHLEVQIRVDSLWSRRVSLGSVTLTRPRVHVRIEEDGSSNVPAPPAPRTPSGTPLRQRLFELVVRELRLEDGEMLFNAVRVPLVAQGNRFELRMDFVEDAGRPSYVGELQWQGMTLVARRYLPFPSDLDVRFTFEPDSFSVTQFVWRLPHTTIDAQVSLSSFADRQWSFRYRGTLGLEDIRDILRKPNAPGGRVAFSGEGSWAAGELDLAGRYAADDITMGFQWFHTAGIASRGSYRADRHGLEVPDFSARALGGSVNGVVQLTFAGLRFRVDAHAQSVDLATLFAAVDNPSFPVLPLHWAGTVDVRAVTTWTRDFKELESRGVSLWEPPVETEPGEIPATARLAYHYRMADRSVTLEPSEISTPSSRIQLRGALGANNTGIEVTFDTDRLADWNDFINRIRGPEAEPRVVDGRIQWRGRMAGPLSGPTFAGHVVGREARYGQLFWDEIEGDMVYSPVGFDLIRASARRGPSEAQIELALVLTDWSFLPDNPWSFDVTLVRTDSDGLQALLGTSYPAHGVLSGNFHGRGTRNNPEMRGLFDIIAPEGWGWQFDRARGELAVDRAQVRISNAELRFPAPPALNGQPAAPAGLLTGNLLYRFSSGEIGFDLTGAVIPLEGIPQIQTARFPLGGRLSFQIRGEGPLAAPQVTGSLRLVDLALRGDVVGSFDGRLASDGRRLGLELDSAMSAGSLHGSLEVLLSGDYPLTGQINISQLNLNPLMAGALHLTALTGSSSVDGQFLVAGALMQPDTLVVEGDLSRIAFDYEYVRLENNGPVRFAYRRDEIRVEQANLRGADSDFRLTGFARFAGDRAVDLRLTGGVNLRLFSAFARQLDARGPAQVDAAIAGSLSSPRITGRVRVEGASVRYGEFPTGLSQVTGDFVFDASRLVFDNVTAESGGGRLQLSGSLTYGGGPTRYDINARSGTVRIRYPAGMSWLMSGTLRLSGTAEAGLLSGRVTVDRLLLSEEFELGSLLVSSAEPVSAPATTSAYLRNLQLDVQAESAPDARLEWAGGRFQTEASLRLRGTWSRPILLGNIRLLNGDIDFRGNRYQLTRGDINFVNPFRLEPVLNVEATTTIRQYVVTVDFTGPASQLRMSYRSDPPLPSSDIFALLALGQTGEESQLRGLTAVQTPEMGATTLLSEAISSQLGGRLQRLFGISHFSVDPFLAGGAAGQNAAARVTIEQQFSRDLIVTYITDVTSTQQQVIQVEYTLRRDVSIVALRDENGTFGLDVVFKKRFK